MFIISGDSSSRFEFVETEFSLASGSCCPGVGVVGISPSVGEEMGDSEHDLAKLSKRKASSSTRDFTSVLVHSS